MSVNVFARPNLPVVISGAFIIFLRHNHFITEFFLKKKSGEAKDSVIFPFFVLLHKRAKPMLPPCNHFSYPNLLSTFTNHPSNHALLRITSVLPYITSELSVHVCMYACMHVCMYVCMHVCMYVCV